MVAVYSEVRVAMSRQVLSAVAYWTRQTVLALFLIWFFAVVTPEVVMLLQGN